MLVASLNTSQDSIQLSIATDWRVLLFAAVGRGAHMRRLRNHPRDARHQGRSQSARSNPARAGVAGSRERFSMQRLMVVTQIAVSMVLLVGALLFVRSYRNLDDHRPRHAGERHHDWLSSAFRIRRSSRRTKPEFKRQIVEDVRGIPGVQNAAATTQYPARRQGVGVTTFKLATQWKATANSPMPAPPTSPPWAFRFSPDATSLTADTTDAPFVLIVNQAFIRKYLGATPPIGQLVHVMPEPQYPERTYEIVGTIPDTKYNNLRGDTPPMAFVPIDQFPVTAQGPGVAMMIAANDRSSRNHRHPARDRNRTSRR